VFYDRDTFPPLINHCSPDFQPPTPKQRIWARTSRAARRRSARRCITLWHSVQSTIIGRYLRSGFDKLEPHKFGRTIASSLSSVHAPAAARHSVQSTFISWKLRATPDRSIGTPAALLPGCCPRRPKAPARRIFLARGIRGRRFSPQLSTPRRAEHASRSIGLPRDDEPPCFPTVRNKVKRGAHRHRYVMWELSHY
jgi:hypothetical protein